jgi:hypothetical protein
MCSSLQGRGNSMTRTHLTARERVRDRAKMLALIEQIERELASLKFDLEQLKEG